MNIRLAYWILKFFLIKQEVKKQFSLWWGMTKRRVLKRRSKMVEMFPYYPEMYSPKNYNVVRMELCEIDGDRAILTVVKTSMGHHCGYVRVAGNPFIEKSYNGFLVYIPVHGGLTYAEMDDDGTMVYGFDYNHSDDMDLSSGEVFNIRTGKFNLKPQNPDEIMVEARKLFVSLRLAIQYERRYEASQNPKDTARIIDQFHNELKKEGIIFNLTDNFGAMLNIVCGKI